MQYKLPNFLLIGSARSGTTSLYDNLIHHPDIYLSKVKEIEYFSKYYDRGLDWYASHFRNHNNESIIGEGSVSYSWPNRADVPKRIRNTLGSDIKLVYMVRNPVKRAVSHFYTFMDNHYKDIEEELFGPKDEDAIGTYYIETSRYSHFIEHYLRYFDRRNLKIIVFEDYIKDIEKYHKDVYSFLGLENTDFMPPDIDSKTNALKKPKSGIAMKLYRALTYSRIRDILYPYIPNSFRRSSRQMYRKLFFKQFKKNVPAEVEERLYNELENEITAMEKSLGRPLDIWRQ
ncbi:MAG: sulfotransferase domain-containing protein [bacterium]